MAHPSAGKPLSRDLLIDPEKLRAKYYSDSPDASVAEQRVAFGTSGHRGSALRARSFNEAHILAVTQAICEYRKQQGIDGPLFLGMDTHALSEPGAAHRAGGARRERRRGALHATTAPRPRRSSRTPSSPTTAAARAGSPTASSSRPSHNPPEDGGIKYNPPNGGPADTDVTALDRGPRQRAARRRQRGRAAHPATSGARRAGTVQRVRLHHARTSTDLRERRRPRGDPRREAAARRRSAGRLQPARTGSPSRERYGLDTHRGEPRRWTRTFALHAASTTTARSAWTARRRTRWRTWSRSRTRTTLAFGNDADSDRHGIVTRSAGLMNPNHYLAVAIDYLFRTAPAGARTRRSARRW